MLLVQDKTIGNGISPGLDPAKTRPNPLLAKL